MYKIWIDTGLDANGVPLMTDIPYQASFPPLFYLSISPFAFLKLSPWSMRLVFFIADFLNLWLIYQLAGPKKVASLAYIFTPIVLIQGLIIPEDEVLVATYLLASLYFFKKNRQRLSVFTLALAFNHKIFPIVLLPLFLMNTVVKKTEKLLPKIDYKNLLKYCLIFIGTSAVFHAFYYPYWEVAYKIRLFESLGHQSLWLLLPYTPRLNTLVVGILLLLFFLYSYVKKLDMTSNYLIGSLIFVTFYPSLSFEHLIMIVPLFLVFTEINQKTIAFWIIFSLMTLVTTPMPFPFTFPYDFWLPMMLLSFLGFYYIIFEQIKRSHYIL
ncbi:MAG: hypothetical protein PHU34_01450 [Candidatus Methanoperedens sp.]|nr:hypothetical protein [Candidatus Methanoperedens sp.]